MRTLLIIVGLVVGAWSARAQDTIVLRASAQVEAARAVTLADVAELNGREAQRMGGIVVMDAPRAQDLNSRSLRLGVDAIREVLQKTDIRWGSVTLSGGSCTLSLGPKQNVEAPRAVAGATGPTVRDHVALRLSEIYGVPSVDLKLAFEADRSGILDVPTTGREVVVAVNGTSERTPLSVRVHERGTLIAEGSARVGVQIRRRVSVARGTISRGQRVTDLDVGEEDRWLAPAVRPANVGGVVGAVAKAKIDAGQVFLDRDVETPAVIRKGDLLAVDSIVGGVAIRMNNARALMDGRDGEEILVEQSASLTAGDKAAGRRGKPGTLRVRISGPGRATAISASEL